MKRLNKEARAKRREQVRQLYFNGNMSLEEISKELNWPTTTIWDDVNFLRKNNVVQAREKLPDILSGIVERKLSLIRNAQNNFTLARKQSDQKMMLAWSNEIREIDKDLQEDLIKAGILAKPTEHTVTAQVDVGALTYKSFKSVKEELDGLKTRGRTTTAGLPDKSEPGSNS